MIAFPNCKINLGLHIPEKLPDGYHRIETVMYPIPLSDILEILPSGNAETTLTVTGCPVEGDAGDNLCFKAWKLLREEAAVPAVDIYLHKIVPTGAGLGGGSSDAAWTLKMLNSVFMLGYDPGKLRSLALRLGMDCPFFIDNQPSSAAGKGEILSPCEINLSGYWISVVKPPVHISTAEAYAGMLPKQEDVIISDILKLPLSEWRSRLTNTFETSVFKKHPIIGQIKQQLYELGALYAQMSGSGSAVYGVFGEEPELDSLFGGCFVYKAMLP